MNNFAVSKISLYSKKDRFIFLALSSIFTFFLLKYTFWWFELRHVPHNWTGGMHFFDFLAFSFLSFVVFITTISNIGSWFALAFAARPKHIEPQKGLKVAFLTCFVPQKEPLEMLEETLRSMKNVRYKHDTWVLDEGNSDQVKTMCKQLGVKYFTRFGQKKYNQEKGKFRTRTKAGNHNAWADLHAKNYDIVAQIDMDHVPQTGYFEKTLGYFKDPKVGLVAMPQFYKNTKNWIARGAGEQSFFFHGPMQKGFYGCDMPFLIGTSHVYRTRAMKQIGGYAPTIVEDHLTGMNFYAKGWKGVFVPQVLAQGEGPTNWVDYFNQQMRWSYGLFEILFKHTPKIIFKLKWKQKINYLIAQLYYFTGVAMVVGVVLTFIYLVFGIRSTSMNLFEWFKFSAPIYLLSAIPQIYAHKFSIDPDNEPILAPLGMFLNLGANVIYALAFLKFICGQKLKYMVTQKGSAARSQKVPLETFKFHALFIFAMLIALFESFKNHHGAIQLRFWAIFNILTLGSVVSSIYWDNLSTNLSFLKPEYKGVRYALSFTVFTLIFSALLLSFPLYEGNVKNTLAKQTTYVDEEPISGKVQPPQNGAYLGISLYQHNDTDYLDSTQASVDKKFAVVSYYQSWGINDNKFNKSWATNISQNGSIPMVTWEPWKPINGYDRSESVVDQKQYRLTNIASGQFDSYIKEYAQDVKAYKKPVMIRLAHEMNGNWYPWGSTFNSPQDYILAWRHIHEIFDSTQATNVTWIWSPNEVYFENSVPYANQIEKFYPGDDYVDWVGFSAFNWAGIYKNNVWKSPEQLYGPTLSKLNTFNKPIIIAETASAETQVNTTAKGAWINMLSKYVQENPQIKGVVWFNAKDNGIDWTINSSPASAEAFKTSFGKYFLQGK